MATDQQVRDQLSEYMAVLRNWQTTVEMLLMDLRARAGLEPLTPEIEAIHAAQDATVTPAEREANATWTDEILRMWADAMTQIHGGGTG